MGCRGSKHKSAAGDVAVSPRKKSELQTEKPASGPAVVPEIEEAVRDEIDDSAKDPQIVPPIEHTANGSEAVKNPQPQVVQVTEAAKGGSDGVGEVKEVKDVKTNSEPAEKAPAAEKKEVEENRAGKLISRESPDQYFSSRKEEERIHGIAAEGGGYFSPGFEPGHGGKKEEDAHVLETVEEARKNNIEPRKQENEINAAASKSVVEMGKTNEEIEVKKGHISIEETAAAEDQTLNADTQGKSK